MRILVNGGVSFIKEHFKKALCSLKLACWQNSELEHSGVSTRQECTSQHTKTPE